VTSLLLYVYPNLTFPPREGLHAQNVAQMRAMRAHGFRVGIIACARQPASLDAEALSAHVGGVEFIDVLPIRFSYPAMLLRAWVSPPWASAIERRLRARAMSIAGPAVLQFEGIPMAPLVRRVWSHPVVLDAIDAWSLRQQRLAARASGWRRTVLGLYGRLASWTERRCYPRAAAVVFVSPDDARWMAGKVPGARITSIPVSLPAVSLQDVEQGAPDPDVLRLVFWGDLGVSYLRDGLLWFEAEVLPLLAARGVAIRLMVLGRRAPDETLRGRFPVAEFIEWAPDADAVLRAADAVILPDRSGSGLKNRTLHAMALGLPVVGSGYAFEGIPARSGFEAFIADDPETFAAALSLLWRDVARRRRVGVDAKAFVDQHYGESAVAAKWVALYDSLSHAAVESAS
jgi:glycosyltransferase involved in cell wall biosynthesis